MGLEAAGAPSGGAETPPPEPEALSPDPRTTGSEPRREGAHTALLATATLLPC